MHSFGISSKTTVDTYPVHLASSFRGDIHKISQADTVIALLWLRQAALLNVALAVPLSDPEQRRKRLPRQT